MSFWRRSKKQLKPLSKPTDLQKAEDRFSEQMKTIAEMTNPGEKFFALEAFKAELQSSINKKQSEIVEAATKKAGDLLLGGWMASYASAIGLAAVTGLAPLALLAAPGFYGVAVAGNKKYKKHIQSLQEQHSQFLTLLLEQRRTVVVMAEDMLNTQRDAICKSGWQQGILIAFPGLKSRFDEASADKRHEPQPPAPHNDIYPFRP